MGALMPEQITSELFAIVPYKVRGQWCFDDVDKGIVAEPFVAGMSEMIDKAVGDKDGFTICFCDETFCGFEYTLELVGEEAGGAWYRCPQLNRIGWLCPVLRKYYPGTVPRIIYVAIGARFAL